MKLFFKQLFCKHKYEKDGVTIYKPCSVGMTTFCDEPLLNIISHNFKCSKCGLAKIEFVTKVN